MHDRNDECLMTKHEGMPKPTRPKKTIALLRHSRIRASFVIRHYCARPEYCHSGYAHDTRSNSDQKLPSLHHRLAIQRHIKIAPDTINVCLRHPRGASMFRVGMAERDVNSRNLFVLQNVSDHPKAGR